MRLGQLRNTRRFLEDLFDDGTHILTPRRALLLAVVAGVVAAVGAWAVLEPSNERPWMPLHTRLASVVFSDSTVRVHDVRNFSFSGSDRFTPAYYDTSYDLNKLESAWFVVVPFSKRWRGPAHTFVSFGFTDSQFVSISVEARREKGELYTPVQGLLKRFELIYVVGDERDVIGQRAAFSTEEVYLYPIRAPRERIREVFVEMLRRVNDLPNAPEFYNTLPNNCTSNLVRHVNHVVPGKVPGGIKIMLPGYADEVAQRLGLIDTELDLEQARERFRINDRARRYIDDPMFSLRIRETSP